MFLVQGFLRLPAAVPLIKLVFYTPNAKLSVLKLASVTRMRILEAAHVALELKPLSGFRAPSPGQAASVRRGDASVSFEDLLATCRFRDHGWQPRNLPEPEDEMREICRAREAPAGH